MTLSVHIYVQCISSPSPPYLSMLYFNAGSNRCIKTEYMQLQHDEYMDNIAT